MIRPAALGRALLLLVAFALAACAHHAPKPVRPLSAVTPSPIAGFAPPVVGPGDVLEVSFFERNATEPAAYRIATGDVLAVDVLDHPDLSRDRILVAPDGAIVLPGIGRLAASGRTVQALSNDLTRRYPNLRIRDPRVTVSVAQADARTRGLVDQARGTGGRAMVITVDESAAIDLPFIGTIPTRRSLADLQREVHAAYEREFGGRVAVTLNLRERAPPQVFVLGEVLRPGAVPYQMPMTSLMAVSAAGGFQNTANSADVRLFRLQPDGRFATQVLVLRRGANGEVDLGQELALRPRDVLYVPKTGIAVANLKVEQYIRNMLPTAVGFGLTADVLR